MELKRPAVEDWRDALVAGDTNSFLLLVRNYLGAVKTPYNKHELVSRLEAFMQAPENAAAIIGFLSDDELAVVAAVELLGPSAPTALVELFAYRMKPETLDAVVASLVDRLVLFRCPAADYALAVAPPLRDAALAVVDFGRFFETVPAKTAPEPAWLTGDLICTVFSFLFHGRKQFRKNGLLTKKAQEALVALAPELVHSQMPQLETRYSDVMECFRNTGVIEGVEDPSVNADAFGAVFDRADTGLVFEFAAARHCEVSEDGSSRSFVVDAKLLRNVFEAIPSEVTFGGMGLWRYVKYVATSCGCGQLTDFIVDLLVRFGFVHATKQGYSKPSGDASDAKRSAKTPKAKKADAAPRATPTVIVDGSHVVKVLPEADDDARRFVAVAARPERRDVVLSAIVDRDSAFDAFDAGIGADTLSRRLAELSGGPLPQSLLFSFESWEKEYQSVRLYFGFTIVAKGPSAMAMEHSPAMKRLDVRKLGDGIYFVATDARADIESALVKAGLRLPSRVTGATPGSRVRVRKAAHPKALDPASCRAVLEAKPGKARPNDGDRRIAALHRALKKLDRKDWELRELEARINKKIVLNEAQLKVADFPSVGRLEAGSLDFLGKARVAEDAIASGGAELDIQYKPKGGDVIRVLVVPVELRKETEGLVLVARISGTDKGIEIPISAVSKIRRLRKGFFGDRRHEQH
ncbi:MAG: hypothetical protein NT080_00720 [Spirochaetes bacterium]|nr:hypothetical protein [Spirochaetota bacterium]